MVQPMMRQILQGSRREQPGIGNGIGEIRRGVFRIEDDEERGGGGGAGHAH